MIHGGNNLLLERQLREIGRGGLLDKHRRETGIRKRIREGEQVDLLVLSSENKTNPCVVSVGVDVEEEVAATASAPPTVVLQTLLSWGVGKGVSSAIIDTRIGEQITISANIVNLAVRYRLNATQPGGDAPVFLVSGIVAYGDRPGSGNAALTFTDENVLLLQGASTIVPREIPKYAVAVAWTSDGSPIAATAPDAVLGFLGQAAGSASLVSQANPPPNVFVPIPNGSYFISIANVSPGAAIVQGFRLIYELVL